MKATSNFTPELCCASVEALHLASAKKIERIELCQNLEEGGITPSLGLFQYAKELDLEVHVLIRPRVGGFVYSRAEKEVMLKDIEYFCAHGANGIVVGSLNQQLALDVEFLHEIEKYTRLVEFTFHRAFDELVDWKKSIDSLISFNFKRILSSGRTKNIALAIDNFREIISYVGEKIEIMPGGGVNAENVQLLVRELKIVSVHFSGTKKIFLDESSAFSSTVLSIDEKKVDRILDSIDISLQER